MNAHIEQAMFDQMKEILEEDFQDTLNEFFSSTTDKLNEMQNDCQEAKYDAIRANAHQIKSSSANFGFMTLSEKAKSVEQQAMENNYQNIKDDLTSMQEILVEIQQLLAGQ